MSKRQRLKLRMGLERVKAPIYASQPGFVSKVNEAMNQLRLDLEYIFDQFEEVTPEIMLDVLKPTFEKSKVYCPKKTNELVESAYLEVVQFRGKPKVEMGYAKGGKPSYAAYVHEIVQYKHEAPTQAKFLERAINEDIGSMIDKLAAEYREFMNG